MHDTNGFVEIPDGRTIFQLNQGNGPLLFRLDLVEAVRQCNEISAACQGKANFEHLDAFAAWVREHAGVTLGYAEADWLWDHVHLEYARQKKSRAAGLTSPASMASIPSA